MNIIRNKPSEDDLRRYLYAALNSGFGFSGGLFKYIEIHHPDANGNFEPKAVSDILVCTIGLPEYLYAVADENDKKLSSKNIFTRIVDLNLEDDLVVFETFNSQIYYLFDGEGECLLGPCHDLDLGHGGLIMFRNSGGDPIFQLMKLYDPEFLELGGTMPFDPFPYSRNYSTIHNIEDQLKNKK